MQLRILGIGNTIKWRIDPIKTPIPYFTACHFHPSLIFESKARTYPYKVSTVIEEILVPKMIAQIQGHNVVKLRRKGQYT